MRSRQRLFQGAVKSGVLVLKKWDLSAQCSEERAVGRLALRIDLLLLTSGMTESKTERGGCKLVTEDRSLECYRDLEATHNPGKLRPLTRYDFHTASISRVLHLPQLHLRIWHARMSSGNTTGTTLKFRKIVKSGVTLSENPMRQSEIQFVDPTRKPKPFKSKDCLDRDAFA